MTPPVLEASGLRIERGGRVLIGGLSLGAAAGSITHFRGPNGSGKTTLLRTLAGLVTPDEGEVRWCGEALAHSPCFRRDLNFIGHQSGLSGELSGRENLRFIARLLGREEAGVIEDALERMHASAFADRPVRTLSAGQRQRLSLVRLILFPTRLWMLDEPFTALDQAARGLVETLIEAQADAGGLVLIATHQAFTVRHAVAVIPLAGAPA